MDMHRIEKWFRDYTRTYMDAAGKQRRAMQKKYAHSRRVGVRCRDASNEMGWPAEQVVAAQALGLLHDVSRFAQLAEHGTLLDSRSFDHGERGYEILRSAADVPDMSPWRSVILAGVRYHNRREVTERVRGDRLRFLHLVRDADKSDTVMVLAHAILDRRFADHPESVGLLAVDGAPSPDVLSAVEAGRMVSYTSMRSVADLQLVLLGWIREFRFEATLRRVVRDGFFPLMAAGIPSDRRMRAVLASVKAFAETRIVGGC